MLFNHKGKQKGYGTELDCAANFTRAGYQISLPYQQTAPYDLIIDDGNELLRVQIKSSVEYCDQAKKEKGLEFKLKLIHSGKKYKKGQVDAFATMYNGFLYLFPYKDKQPPRTLAVKTSDLGKYVVI